MKTMPLPDLSATLPRRDILAICVYLNRARPKRVDACVSGPDSILDRLAAAARMQ
jgi:hypothetical protein